MHVLSIWFELGTASGERGVPCVLAGAPFLHPRTGRSAVAGAPVGTVVVVGFEHMHGRMRHCAGPAWRLGRFIGDTLPGMGRIW